MPLRAILFDLDDTLVCAYGRPDIAWPQVTADFADRLAPLDPVLVAEAIVARSRVFWNDPELRSSARWDIPASRRLIVAAAFAELGKAGHVEPEAALAIALADRFSAFRDAEMRLAEGALELVTALRRRGLLLGLVTNGGSASQRDKLARFGLAQMFDHVQIEEEAGFGKPEPLAYAHALAALGVGAHEAWMVGDHIEWDVGAPQALGIEGVWLDAGGRGAVSDGSVVPRRTIRVLGELVALLDAAGPGAILAKT